MQDLAIWKDEQFQQLRAELDRLFGEFLGDFANPKLIMPGGGEELPSIEVSEGPAEVVIRMAFPGLDPAELEIAVSPEVVIIEAVRREKLGQAAGKILCREDFRQRITLPCRVEPEGAEAVCFDHRLELHLPKSRAAAFRKVALRRAGS